MKTITKRLSRLEERFGLLPETEFDRRLRARIEAAPRRLAEARERGELGPLDTGPFVEACRRRFMEALGFSRSAEAEKKASLQPPNRVFRQSPR
jgi:hypothetical protein